ncbi:hypothetical protein A7A09_008350 [Paracoccus methylarcula]|uniref:Polyketide synthase n=2 Tax=Paracoccus methylarcula TaxID=72022 RepID=A0A3R7LQ48_9RHOB|nr:hypothetical protein A7A09_008350 [Paracoccus methylarcula]
MRKFAHIVMTLFLALYAAGAVVHSASASAMTIEMVTSAEQGMEMSGCEGCEIDEDAATGGPACDMICTTPVAATFAVLPGPVLEASLLRERPLGEILSIGRTGSPEPFPPRTPI